MIILTLFLVQIQGKTDATVPHQVRSKVQPLAAQAAYAIGKRYPSNSWSVYPAPGGRFVAMAKGTSVSFFIDPLRVINVCDESATAERMKNPKERSHAPFVAADWYKKGQKIVDGLWPDKKWKPNSYNYILPEVTVTSGVRHASDRSNVVMLEYRTAPKNGFFDSCMIELAQEDGRFLNAMGPVKPIPMAYWKYNLDPKTRPKPTLRKPKPPP